MFKIEVAGSGSGLEETMDPDPVCPERLDPNSDPVNIRPDPKPCLSLSEPQRSVYLCLVKYRPAGAELFLASPHILTRDRGFRKDYLGNFKIIRIFMMLTHNDLYICFVKNTFYAGQNIINF